MRQSTMLSSALSLSQSNVKSALESHELLESSTLDSSHLDSSKADFSDRDSSTPHTPPLAGKPLESASVAIIGLGFVGLPLYIAFAARYVTIGFDSNATRIDELRQGVDSSGEYTDLLVSTDTKHFTHNPHDLRDAQIYIIAVPTPITSDNLPDLSHLRDACELVGVMLQKGDMVIFESTTYPTCTRNFCIPILESTSTLRLNHGFYVGYSPERINPADKLRRLPLIQKLTSGSNQQSAHIIDRLYASVITAGTHCVESIEIAEASKALENAQRDVNIAFMNEAYMLFESLHIPMDKVLEAANTKWNFLSFYPGLVGGHCISVDPYYLSHIARRAGSSCRLIESAREVNELMPEFLAHTLAKALAKKHRSMLKSRVLIVGFAFKKDCNDARNTKVPLLCDELEALGACVCVLDSLIDKAHARKLYDREIVNAKELVRFVEMQCAKSQCVEHKPQNSDKNEAREQNAHIGCVVDSGVDSSDTYAESSVLGYFHAIVFNIVHTCDEKVDCMRFLHADGVVLDLHALSRHKPS